jgi:molybdate transport system substrate-binding protein
MDYVAKAGLIKDDTRSNILGNRLVLIAPQSSPVSLKIEKDFALGAALGDGRFRILATMPTASALKPISRP